MKVQVLVQRRNHFFIVEGETASADLVNLVNRIDPLVLHEPKYMSPPIPATSADPMIHAFAEADGSLKTMQIKQADVVIVAFIEEEKEEDDGTD